MQLDPWFRRAIYLVAATLFLTGTAWCVGDQLTYFSQTPAWQDISANLLMIHGGAAMLFLLFLGALGARHVPLGWRVGMNRAMGLVIVGSSAVLVGTAFGLYYFGSDALRRWTSDLHIVIGLGWPAVLALHVTTGRQSVRTSEGQQQMRRKTAARRPEERRGLRT